MKGSGILPILLVLACGCAAPALYNSAQSGDTAKVAALLAAGADPNEKYGNVGDETPLHAAAVKGNLEAALLLIEKGADVNARAGASTPLHYSICSGSAEMVRLLLEKGANPEPGKGCCNNIFCKPKYAETPLALAEHKGYAVIAALLRSAIARRVELVSGSFKNADEYGPLVNELLKGYQGEGKTIAVAGFSYTDGRASNDGGVVAERVTTELVKTKKLKVVERKEIEKMLVELKLQSGGAIDQDSAKKLGKLLGADLVVVGTMVELPGNLLELNMRMASVGSGEAVGAVSGRVEKDWLGK